MLLSIVIFLFFLILCLCIVLHKKKKKEKRTKRKRREQFISSLSPVPPLSPTPITFLSENELSPILLSDKDNFFQTFFDYDLRARQSQSLEEYKQKFTTAISSFSPQEKQRLLSCAEQSDIYLMKTHYPWFDGVKASNIPWNLGKVTGKIYEDGLPHTRFQNFIILSTKNLTDDDKTLTRTLIHEKIHLYQKQYPEDVKIYLDYNNIIKVKPREYNDLIRANPDLDNWIYKEQKTGFVFKCEYNSKFPNHILDVKNNNQLYEHPFEKMAIDVTRNFS